MLISKTYDKQTLDGDFYEKEFEKARRGIAGQARNDGYKNARNDGVGFDSVKEHFTEKWNELLTKKQLAWELEIIDRERKKFCGELYRKIEELKKLQEVLSPFTNELGRLWDMSSGQWQNTNFDILKRYAELMQRNVAIPGGELCAQGACQYERKRKVQQQYKGILI